MFDRDDVLSGSFLQSVVRHSKYVGLALAIGGALLTHDWRFVLALAIGSTVDIASLAWIAQRAELAAVGTDLAKAVVGVTVFRLIVKSLLVAGAALLGSGAIVWGMILGVLVVEITLMTVGLVESIRGTKWQ